MAGRPPLDIGTYGKIRTRQLGPEEVRAYCRYRDIDGQTRQVTATGRSIAAAERALKKALAQRSTNASVTAETRVRVAAEAWYETVVAAVESGQRSPTTAREYRSLLDRHVLPATGGLRLREVTTGRADAVLSAIKAGAGEPTAKSCRTVISGILKHAARHDAVSGNAVRDTQPLSGKPRRPPRALTVAECAQWLSQLAMDDDAVRHDLVDLSGFLLGVGCRIGEALAVAWDSVDMDEATVALDYTLCRVKGRPLFRKGTKSAAGERTLPLPQFVLAMLDRRAMTHFALQAGYLPPAGARASDLVLALGSVPVFPDTRGGWRDPSNTQRSFRFARGEFDWVSSHTFRKTAATFLDASGLPARLIADQLGHAQVSLTQDVYLARKVVDGRAAKALEEGFGKIFADQKAVNNRCMDLGGDEGKLA